MKTLIVYYSQARGNTRRIVEMAASAINADIAEIRTFKPYEGSYEDIVEQGKDEINSGFMPEIEPLSFNTDDYDRIIVGTPTWWYTMAPAVKTFLTKTDLSCKNVVLLQTHGGWQGHTFKDMKALIKGTVTGEFAVQFDSTGGDKLVTEKSKIEEWIKSL